MILLENVEVRGIELKDENKGRRGGKGKGRKGRRKGGIK